MSFGDTIGLNEQNFLNVSINSLPPSIHVTASSLAYV